VIEKPDFKEMVATIRKSGLSYERIANIAGVDGATVRSAMRYNSRWNPRWTLGEAIIRLHREVTHDRNG
jgi:hypothetical protein